MKGISFSGNFNYWNNFDYVNREYISKHRSMNLLLNQSGQNQNLSLF